MIRTRTRKSGPVFQPSRGQIVSEEMGKGLAAAAEALSTEIKRVSPVATGKMQAGIRVIPGLGAGKIVQSGEWYATPLDKGTSASPVPIKPLVEWVTQKLGLYGVQARQVAFMISKKHKANPQKARRFFIATYRKNRKNLIKQYIEPIVDKTVRILG